MTNMNDKYDSNLHNLPVSKTIKMLMLTLVSASVLSACNQEVPKPTMPAPTVVTMIVAEKDATVTEKLPGRTVASVIAEVRPQVGGIILKQSFSEGRFVNKGEALYLIDPALYQASVAQAEAGLNRAKANQNAVRIRMNRLKDLVKSNAISKQEFDDVEAMLLQADADVLAATATLKNAQINLEYTNVVAPITGQIGRSTVTQGALVTPAQANQLATIQQFDPMKVYITLPASTFTDLKERIRSGKIESDPSNLRVDLLLENGKAYPHQGKVTFTDPTVDPSTGTILIQAEFPNPDLLLLPGAFVNTLIQQGVEKNAIMVPQKSVSRTPQGEAMVYLITREGQIEKVAPHVINIARSQDNQWVVESGLKAGDQIVVEGIGAIERMRGKGEVKTIDVNAPKEVAANPKK